MKLYIRADTSQETDSEGNIVPPELSAALKNSKIRNRKGQLIVCYHGTNSDFEEFKDDFISQNSGNIGWFGKGFYFTDCTKLAQSYGSNLKKCYLNITNPFIYSGADAVWNLLTIGGDPHSYNGRLVPYAYLDDPEPIENFTTTVKNAGYDGVKFSYKQAKYKPNISGATSASEFVCFNNNQIFQI